MEEDDRLLKLAISVSDGEAVDWETAERVSASQEQRGLVHALKAISEIGQVYRSLQSTATEDLLPDAAEPGLERWGHLEILANVGEGSYGAVYRARDIQLNREVALKLLRHDAGTEEALTEARLLARVRHPNVATVHGADRRDGRVGFWMEFIVGSTLAELLHEQGPFGPREAALCGLELCHALAAVHAQGIVHRDVKAQNVMREKGGRIVLTDFGIGKDLGRQDQAERSLSGTPLYLAPEVLAGAEATVQSDIYALGVLLYHLVTDSFPVHGRSMEELHAAHEGEQIRLLRDVRPDLPEPFVRAVERALAKDPGERYGSAGVFEKALVDVLGERGPWRSVLRLPFPPSQRTLWLAGSAALLTVVLVTFLWVARREPAALPQRVLVADFDNRTNIRLFGTIRHLVTLALGQSARLDVVSYEGVAEALQRMRRPPGARLDPETAKEVCLRDDLGILVAGEIAPTEHGYNLVVSATDPVTGATRAVVEAELSDPQDLIAAVDQLAAELRHQLGEPRFQVESDHRPLEQATTGSLEALQRFTRALDLDAQGKVSDAIGELRAALELDPDFALAYSRLAVYLGGEGKLGEALAAAEAAYQRREQVSPREGYRIAGAYDMSLLRYEEALADYRRAVELDPHDADSARLAALLHVNLGDAKRGLVEARAARDHHPQNVLNQGVLPLMLAIAGRADEGLEEVTQARRRLGAKAYFYWPEGLAWLMKDDPGHAEEAFRKLAEEGGHEEASYESYGRLYLAQTLVYEGRLRQAAVELEASLGADAREKYERTRKLRNDFLARIYLLLGDEREARRQVEWLESQVKDAPIDLKHLRSAALLRVELKDLQQARELLARIERLRDGYPGDLARGVAAQVRGEIERAGAKTDAARDSLEVARLAWEEPSTLRSLARFRIEQGDCHQAVPILQELLSRKGWILHEYFAADWVLAHLDLARCQSQLGQLPQARASYDGFLSLWGEGAADLPAVRRARRERNQISRR